MIKWFEAGENVWKLGCEKAFTHTKNTKTPLESSLPLQETMTLPRMTSHRACCFHLRPTLSVSVSLRVTLRSGYQGLSTVLWNDFPTRKYHNYLSVLTYSHRKNVNSHFWFYHETENWTSLIKILLLFISTNRQDWLLYEYVGYQLVLVYFLFLLIHVFCWDIIAPKILKGPVIACLGLRSQISHCPQPTSARLHHQYEPKHAWQLQLLWKNKFPKSTLWQVYQVHWRLKWH